MRSPLKSPVFGSTTSMMFTAIPCRSSMRFSTSVYTSRRRARSGTDEAIDFLLREPEDAERSADALVGRTAFQGVEQPGPRERPVVVPRERVAPSELGGLLAPQRAPPREEALVVLAVPRVLPERVARWQVEKRDELVHAHDVNPRRERGRTDVGVRGHDGF